MKLNYIHIDAFGKFRDLRIDLEDGINIIYGRNEAGKSTLHAFLMAMLFGLEDKPGRLSGEQRYERYKNWEDGSVYGGELSFSHEGQDYILRRDFLKGLGDLCITDAEGRRLEKPEELLSEALLSLTEAAYRSTISLGQLKAATGRELIRELKRYITNLNTTGNAELSAEGALEVLDRRKEQLQKSYDPDAVKDYAALVGQIKNLETELSSPDNDNSLAQYVELKEDTEAEIADTRALLSELRERRERAKALLSENGFTDKHSIDDAEEELIQDHEAYLKHKQSSEKLIKRLIPVIFLLMSFCMAGTAFMFTELSVYSFYGLIGGAVCSLLIAAVFALLCSRERKQVETEQRELGERLKERLGNDEVSEAAFGSLHERMEGFRRLYDTDVSTIKEESELSDKLLELSRKQNGYQEDIYRQQNTNREVEDKLIKLNELRNRSLELRSAIAENNRLKEDMDAIELAKENLSELSAELKASTGAYINRAAGDIMKEVTADVYDHIELTEGMEVYVGKKGRSVPLQRLSMGTIDQVYLALRLAAIRVVEGGIEDGRLPVLFDDSFTLYDDDRLKYALQFIAGHFKGQILLFTCQHREQNLLNEAHLEHNYIELA